MRSTRESAVGLIEEGRQCKTKVLMRLGTSPAGITAMDLRVFVSIADTERAAELET